MRGPSPEVVLPLGLCGTPLWSLLPSVFASRFCLGFLPWLPSVTEWDLKTCALEHTLPIQTLPILAGVYYHSDGNKGWPQTLILGRLNLWLFPYHWCLFLWALSGERLEINSRYQYLLSSSQSLRESFSNSVTFPGLPVDSFSSRPPLSQSRWRGKLLKSCNFKSSWRGDSWEWLHFQNPRLIGCEGHFLCALSLLQQFL